MQEQYENEIKQTLSIKCDKILRNKLNKRSVRLVTVKHKKTMKEIKVY